MVTLELGLLSTEQDLNRPNDEYAFVGVLFTKSERE